MDIKGLHDVVVRFMATDSNNSFEQENCWNEMIKILSADIPDTINYIKNNCSDEDFFWIGPVFEDVVEKTQSEELVTVLRDRLAKVSLENYNQQSFRSEYMRKYVDYDEYVRSVTLDIESANQQFDAKK